MTKVLLTCVKLFLNFIYFFIKIFPSKQRIVMISRQSNDINMDFKLLKDELEKDYQVICLCKTLDGGIKSSMKSRIKYGFHMFTQMYYLATSKVCILDSYCPTVSVLKHKKDLTIIQIWHSIGTMKKFGYAILDKGEGSRGDIARIMKMHQNYDVIVCSGKAYKSHLASGFGCSEDKIVISSLPRVDLLTDNSYEKNIKKKIYDTYPILKEKKNIVYCPTFRKDESKFNKALDSLIKDIDLHEYNIIVKLHPLSKVRLEQTNSVIVDKDFSTFDMLFIADACISDYSCVIYEAGIRSIPLYFYMFDLDEYKDNRGLAIDYNELPGVKSASSKDIASSLKEKYDYKYLKKFINKYVENNKNCTKELVNIIKKYMK